MKTQLVLAGLAMAAFGLVATSCSESKLANDLNGSWKGQTMSMTGKKKGNKEGKMDRTSRPDMGEMTCTPTFTFVKTDGTNGGTLDIAGDFTITKEVETIATQTPVNATVSGNVTASGTWMVKDDDEVKIILNPESTVVNVDTASINLSYTTLTDAPKDDLAAIKAKIAENASDVITPMITKHIQRLNELDDVKINGDMMQAEINHTKAMFNKVK